MRHFTFGKPQKNVLDTPCACIGLRLGIGTSSPGRQCLHGSGTHFAGARRRRKFGRRGNSESRGCVTHIFPPAALIGQVPAGMQTPAGVSAIYRQAVDEASLSTLTGATRRAAQVWNALLSPQPAPLQSLTAPRAADSADLPGLIPEKAHPPTMKSKPTWHSSARSVLFRRKQA
jgi:hypothetical protein